jgi:hypothetical protein
MNLSSHPFRKRAMKWRASWLGGRRKKSGRRWLNLAKKDGRLGNQTEVIGLKEHRPSLINISEPETRESPASHAPE